jgi:hypothetical protein
LKERLEAERQQKEERDRLEAEQREKERLEAEQREKERLEERRQREEKELASLVFAFDRKRLAERCQREEKEAEEQARPAERRRPAAESSSALTTYQSIHQERIRGSAAEVLFPLHGVTLGKTTLAELRELGKRTTSISENTHEPYKCYEINDLDFWYQNEVADHSILLNGEIRCQINGPGGFQLDLIL